MVKVLIGIILIFGSVLVVAQVLSGEQTPVDSLVRRDASDYKAFYLGFRETPSEKTFFTFRITELDSTANSIWFVYTLNTVDNRIEGEGRIYLEKGEIDFGKNNKGIIRSDQDGRIVFESSQSDTTKHWTMKEM
jgi:hypothetical protein